MAEPDMSRLSHLKGSTSFIRAMILMQCGFGEGTSTVVVLKSR